MPRPSEAEGGPNGDSLRLQLEMLAGFGVIVAVAFTPAASLLRLGLPALSLVVPAIFLLRGDLRRYVALCIWLFVLTPFIRRVVDYNAGFEQVSYLMLSPYLAGAFSIGTVAFAMERPRHAVSIGLLLIVGAACFGLMLSTTDGDLLVGSFGFLRWVVPPCFGMLIAINAGRYVTIFRDVQALLVLAVIGTGAYGAVQYVTVPPWDVFWMESTQATAFGGTGAFELRVFATLNSPGSFAAFLTIALVLLLAGRGALRWPALFLGSAALAMTSVRAAWLGFAIAVLVYLLSAPNQIRTATLAFLLAGASIAPLALVNETASEAIFSRISTMGDLSSDTSMNDRLQLYATLFDELEKNILGTGLVQGQGSSGDTAANGIRSMVIDGGPVEVVIAVGVVGAVVYYLGIVALLIPLFTAPRRADATEAVVLAASRTVVIMGLVLQMTGPSTVGEMGFFFWVAFGLGLACVVSMVPEPDAARPRPGPVLRALRPDPIEAAP